MEVRMDDKIRYLKKKIEVLEKTDKNIDSELDLLDLIISHAINKAEKKLEKKPYLALWKPEINNYYYYSNIFGLVSPLLWKNTNDNHITFELGNISPTEKLAELKKEIKLATEEYKRKVAEFNGDWEPDWKDVYQRKYYLLLTRGAIGNNWITSAYEPEKEGFYFSWYVANNEQQISKLKELYQKIRDLTKECKEAEKEWRNE